MPRRKKQPEPVDTKNFRVSQSKVKTWRRCRQAYHYKYIDEIKAKRKTRALTFGSLIHKMIETDAGGDDAFGVLDEIDLASLKLFEQERQEYGDIVEDVRRIMTEYFDHWETDGLSFVRMKGKSAEHSFEIEILPGVIWNGKIDAIGKRGGLRWLIEHKSFKRMPTDDDRWRNLQSASYFRAMDMLGWKSVDGTCWDYVWSKPPAKPGILKDGSMSKKALNTLPIAVKEAVREYGLKLHDYRDFIKGVERNRNQWFQRIYTRVDESARDFIFDDFISTVKEMVDGHGVKKDMNIERHCSWCEYEPLCRARMQSLDYDFIKERHYESSANRPIEEADHTLGYEEE